MKLINTNIEGLKIIEGFKSTDDRGLFFKVFNTESLELDFKIEEVFYSINEKDVIRGMHFQIPPYENHKVIHVISGSITDVVIDLRKNSKSFKEIFEVNLDSQIISSIIVPPGCAHGFKALENNTAVLYLSSRIFSKRHDFGINYKSIEYDWNLSHEIVSEKDSKLIFLSDFLSKNPF